MRLSRTRPPATLGMNLTPMIDIVFLLIIFFITVSQIAPLVHHPLDLPRAAVLGEAVPPRIVTINIDRAGIFHVAGRTVDHRELAALLDRELASSPASAPRPSIVIRCDRRAESRGVNELVGQLQALGFDEVRLGVQEPD